MPPSSTSLISPSPPPQAEYPATTAAELYTDVSTRARRLLDELAAFQEYIVARNGGRSEDSNGNGHNGGNAGAVNQVFTSKFQREVERDVAVLERHGVDIRARASRETLHGSASNGTRERSGRMESVRGERHEQESDVHGAADDEEEEEEDEFNEHQNGVVHSHEDHDDEDMIEQNLMHKIRSSNISFHEAIWAKAKRSEGIVAFRKKVKFLPMELMDLTPRPHRQSRSENTGLQQQTDSDSVEHRRSKRYTPLSATKASGFKPKSVRRDHKETIIVDVIADDGSTWVKVATASEKRLLMDLAKEGIVNYSSDEEEEEESDDGEAGTRVHKDYAELKLIKTAEEYMAAARTTRVRYQHPRVVMYLPHVREGCVQDIDKVLKELRKTGVEVETADTHPPQTNNDIPPLPSQQQSITTTFDKMLVTPVRQILTATINMDCTALIALVSDISHCARATVQVPSHYEQDGLDDIENQFQADLHNPLLPRDIYPLLAGRKLVCTAKTAAHLRNIVRIMGSEHEKERARLFLSSASLSFSDSTADAQDKLVINDIVAKTESETETQNETRRKALQALSIHPLPPSLHLPIQIVDFDLEPILHPPPLPPSPNNNDNKKLTLRHRVIRLLSQNPKLSGLNRSVFFHGWLSEISTVSLNRVFSEWIEREINYALNVLEQGGELEGEKGFEGPRIVVSGRERSLLGSEKGRERERAGRVGVGA